MAAAMDNEYYNHKEVEILVSPNRPLLAVIFTLFIACLALGQTINDIKSCVNFIYLPNANGDLVPNGTGFFIGVDDTTQKMSGGYVVTAKHVLWDTSTKTFVPNGWLRLNRRGGEPSFVRMPMHTTGVGKNVFVHPDSTVDLVVVQGLPDPEKYDFSLLPSQLIRRGADLKRIGLAEGTDVFFPALFLPHIGEHQNYPIVRFGKLALVSGEERIRWGDEMQHLHLIESISIGGHSGAPVFVWFEPKAELGTPVTHEDKLIRLVGVMQGRFYVELPIGIRKTSVFPVYQSHTGVSAVVPVDMLYDILFGPELTQSRAKQ